MSSMSSLSSLSSISDEESNIRNIPERKDLWNEFDGDAFVSRFRFNKPSILYILSKIGHLIRPVTRRSKAIDARTQLLLTLRFYATGSFQEVSGDLVNCSKATVCRIVQKVTKAIASLAATYIKVPTLEECDHVAQEFYELAGFPIFV